MCVHVLRCYECARVLYVSYGSKVRPRTFGCVAMCRAVLFILRSRLLLYSAVSEVNLMQAVMSAFSVRLFCFVQRKTLCRYDCMHFFVGFWDGDCVSQIPYVWYYVAVKSSSKHAREECESKRANVFRCLIFSLSGPCELLLLRCFIAYFT